MICGHKRRRRTDKNTPAVFKNALPLPPALLGAAVRSVGGATAVVKADTTLTSALSPLKALAGTSRFVSLGTPTGVLVLGGILFFAKALGLMLHVPAAVSASFRQMQAQFVCSPACEENTQFAVSTEREPRAPSVAKSTINVNFLCTEKVRWRCGGGVRGGGVGGAGGGGRVKQGGNKTL